MSADEMDEQPDLGMRDDSLMSYEELRDSPILWTEKIPGVNKYVQQNIPPQTETPSWDGPLTPEEIVRLRQLGNLSITGLIAEVKKIHDTAYNLGIEESKEMTRGKYLNIFQEK